MYVYRSIIDIFGRHVDLINLFVKCIYLIYKNKHMATAFNSTQPHPLAILPPQHDIETRAVLKACISARAAVAELRAAGMLIPNQGVLINSIPLLEAQASSEIENIITTADRMFLFDAANEADVDTATQEAMRYREALWLGFRSLDEYPLTTRTAVDVCRVIKGVNLDIRKTSGTHLLNDRTGEVIYTPPENESHLRDLLANWERFMQNESDIDPLIRMAVGHYQFEAIHPFVDGNGRTGRVLNLLYLVEQKLLDLPVLYLSRHIVQNKTDYYRLLLQVTSHDTPEAWDAWVRYMLEAVTQTAQWTTRKIHAIKQLIDVTAERVRRDAPGIYSREFVELIFERPYCRIGHVIEKNIAKRQTAAIYLKKLVDIGVVREQKVGREKLFVNQSLMDLLKRD